jgi:adenylosuccinate lyase
VWPESSHIRDSLMYGQNWAVEPVRSWFTESRRIESWLEILGAIAQAQADVGAVPRIAADDIAQACAHGIPDLGRVAERSHATGHSTAGLLEAVRGLVRPEHARYVGLGTSVQDIADTWTALTMKLTAERLEQDLGILARRLADGAARHRDTVMLARTHGQPGAPVTFGFKQAQWGAELARHQSRLAEGRPRWETAQLGGSVGSLAFWGADAPGLLTAFACRVGLRAPVLPWGSARDCVAEFGQFAALVGATLAKIGNEIYQLQRPEIGELGEPATGEQIGSVTMPHKRNPERSEQLVTLGRLLRAHASVLLEGAVTEHERDGRGWKAEWVALPDVCCAVTCASALCADLLADLEVHDDRMRANIEASSGLALSEHAVRVLEPRLGLPTAYGAVRRAALATRAGEFGHLADALGDVLGDELAELADPRAAAASATAFADQWVRAATAGGADQTTADLTKSATTLPSVSPASSGILWPALASRTCGWPIVPGTSPWNIASAPPPMGSCSP